MNKIIPAIQSYWNKLNPTVQHYLESAWISFLAGFFMVLATNAQHLTFASFHDGAYLGILLLALRTGTKAAWDILLALISYLKDRYTTPTAQ